MSANPSACWQAVGHAVPEGFFKHLLSGGSSTRFPTVRRSLACKYSHGWITVFVLNCLGQRLPARKASVGRPAGPVSRLLGGYCSPAAFSYARILTRAGFLSHVVVIVLRLLSLMPPFLLSTRRAQSSRGAELTGASGLGRSASPVRSP